MEHRSSYQKQLRKKVAVRAVMIKKIRLSKSDLDKNDGK